MRSFLAILFSFIFFLPAPLFSADFNSLQKNLKNKEELLDFFKLDLQKSRLMLNDENYESLVSEKVCLYLDTLKNIEKQQAVFPVKRLNFLKELILFYNKALDLKQESVILSCFYNYYGSSQNKEIFKITAQFLSPEQKERFLDLLQLFEKGELEGNGDNIEEIEGADKLLNEIFESSLIFDEGETSAVAQDDFNNTTYQNNNLTSSVAPIYLEDKGEKNKSAVVDYFIESIFKNSQCFCEENNGCTRGCKPKNEIYNKEGFPKIRRCVRKKSLFRSTAYCARHVNSAIMNTVNEFLSLHCKRFEPSIKSYQQCVKDFNSDVKNRQVNICQNGFAFPSALCMVNLSGESFSSYNRISNRYVRAKCKNWDKYNRLLYSFSIPYLDDTQISLFKKWDVSQYKQFEKDPSKIPIGAIVVSKAYSRHGHVEVKTNKMLCGQNKNQTCFCSDYCLERKRYRWPFKILAVYEWSPKFLEYVELTSHL